MSSPPSGRDYGARGRMRRPSITTRYVAIVTGATGSQHGVTGNGDVSTGDFATYPHYLSLLETADADAMTACLFTWGTDAEIPSGADYIKDGEDADNVERVAAMLAGTHADALGDSGTAWVSGQDVDAVFLFLDDPDHVGHADGFEPGVGAYLEEIASVDAQIGTLLDAIVARPTFETEAWQIVITSDHGGYHTSHGGDSAVEHTIPWLVASPQVAQGLLPTVTRIVDVTPTVLDHMGVPIPEVLTGAVRGAEVDDTAPPPLSQDLVAYYRFDGDLTDSSGGGLDAIVGEGSDVDPTLTMTGGKFGGHLSLTDPGGGQSDACYLSLGQPAALDMGPGQPMSVTLWFRSHGLQGGDPVILGNKDWVSGYNAGWLLLANEGGDNSFGANFASGGDARVDLEDVDYTDTQWWFLAVSYDPDGLAVMVAGDA
ncbi:MAG: alkaline phosphatase family protein, partial [Myxococcota bacterium]|nr:alkaline phosphatase family protein [Myxococcota bacterium]